MSRPLLTLAVGLLGGIGAHFGYYTYHEHQRQTLEGQLTWIKSELNLTDTQFSRIRELHQASHPKLRAMAAQVAHMQAEFAEFEQSRRTADRVDFIEFARFVQMRRELNRECLDSKRQLVLASAEVMTPEQRERYMRLVSAPESLAGTLLN